MKLVPLCRTLRVVAAFGLAFTGVALVGQPLPAQEAAKGAPARPAEVYQQFRSHIAEGKYDIAALFLQSLMDSLPPDADQILLDIEARHGTTVFRQLRTIPKWSDDPKLDKKARENVELLIKKATDATEKVLRNPARVAKYIRNLGESYEEKQFAELELKRTGDYAIPFMVETLKANLNPTVTAGILETIPKLEFQTMGGWLAGLDGLSPAQQYTVLARMLEREDVLALLTKAQTDIRPYLWGSSVSIVPLRIGSGTRLKIYESMAAKTPVVSTTIGAEGLIYDNGKNIAIADSPQDFAARSVELIQDAAKRTAMAQAAFGMVSDHFSWEQVTREFDAILAKYPAKKH